MTKTFLVIPLVIVIAVADSTSANAQQKPARWEQALKKQAASMVIKKEVHVALMTGISREEPSPAILAELLSALSEDDKINLVERELINQVLAEQRLTLAGLTNYQTRIQAGKLLNADVLVFFERLKLPKIKDSKLSRKRDTPGRIYRIRAVEGKTGIVLGSDISSEQRLRTDVRLVVNMIRAAILKVNAGQANRHYLGYVGFRSEELGRSLDSAAKALGALVLNDLNHSPNIVLLERQQMEKLTREKALTGVELKLQTSALLLEGGVKWVDDGKQLQITANLKTLKGKTHATVTVTAPGNDIASLRQRLANAIVSRLKAGKIEAAPLPPKVESAIFWKHAQDRLTHFELEQAGWLAEAALALNDTPATRRQAAKFWRKISYNYLLLMGGMSGGERSRQSPRILRTAQRDFELYCQSQKALAKTRRSMEMHSYLKTVSDRFKPQIRHAAMTNPAGWQEWLKLQQMHVSAYKRMLNEYKQWDKQEKSRKRFLIMDAIGDFKYWTEDPAEWRKLLKEAFAVLEANPYLREPTKGEQGELTDRKILAWTLRSFHRAAHFWENKSVPFRKPGAAEVEREISQWGMAHKDPMLRLAAHTLTIKLGYGGLRNARAILDTYLEEFPLGHLIHKKPAVLFPRRSVAWALRTLSHNKSEFHQYNLKIFEPMLNKKHVKMFAYWNDPYMYWLKRLEQSGDLKESEKWTDKAIEVLKGETYPFCKTSLTWLERYQAKLADETGRKLPKKVLLAPKEWDAYELRVMPLHGLPSRNMGVRPDCYGGSFGNLPNRLVIAGERLFFLKVYWGGANQTRLMLYRAPATGGRVTLLADVLVPREPKANPGPTMLVSGDTVYVGVFSGGLTRFGKGMPKTWTTKNGLPTNYINCMALLKGKLYIGSRAPYSGSGRGVPSTGSLSVFDPETGRGQVLCSHKAVSRRGPLDGEPVYTVYALVADPERNCLWLGVHSREGARKRGLWQYLPAENKFQKVPNMNGNVYSMQKEGDRLFVFRGTRTHDLYNMKTRKWSSIKRVQQPFILMKDRIFFGSRYANQHFGMMALADYKPVLLKFLTTYYSAETMLHVQKYRNTVIFGRTGPTLWMLRPKTGEKPAKGWQEASVGYTPDSIEYRRQLFRASRKMYNACRTGRCRKAPLAEAMQLYDEALKLKPKDPYAYLSRATSLYRYREYNMAIADCTKAIELQPECLDAYFTRAKAYRVQKQYRNAWADMKMAEKLQPTDPAIKMELDQLRPKVEQLSDRGRRKARKAPEINLTWSAKNVPPKYRQQLKNLASVIRRGPPAQREKALRDLRELGRDARALTPLLIWCLGSKDTITRRNSLFALGSIGPSARTAMPHLFKHLEDRDANVRRGALFAMRMINVKDKRILPTATKMLRDKDPGVCSEAVRVLVKIGPPAKSAVTAMEKSKEGKTELYKVNATEAIGKITGDFEPILRIYRDQLKEEIFYERWIALRSLGDLGPAAKQAVPDMIIALDDPKIEVRRSAAYELGRIGPAAKEAVPALGNVLADNDLDIKANAAFALWNITGKAGRYAKIVIAMLENPSWKVRESGAYLLGERGQAARIAAPKLKLLLQDENRAVREAAKKALSKITQAIEAKSGSK